MKSKYIAWFKDVNKNDVALVGGKGANLGEMTRSNFPIPNGFIVTVNAYYDFIKENNLIPVIKKHIDGCKFDNSESLNKTSKEIKKIIVNAKMSENLAKEVFTAYRKLSGAISDTLVAVRSSATAEDLPTASFAGQQETYLNVKGEANVLLKIKDAWASLFEARAIFYRHEQKFDHFRVGIAIPVQKMVESDASGIMFTIDPVTNDKSKIVIEGIYGLGELIVQGEVTPDHYEVEKQNLKIILKHIEKQKIMLKKVGQNNKKIEVPNSKQHLQKISDKIIVALADLGKKLEKHYYFPQDSEWAVKDNKVYLVQTRAITTSKSQSANYKQKEITNLDLPLLVKGDPASPGIVSGPARLLQSAKEINKIQPGDVLIAPQTNPDFVPAMKKAIAIITEKGGRTSHAAIVSRELGIPAVVGAANAMKIIKTGNIVTVNGTKGEVYKGGHIKLSTASHLSTFIPTVTKVYVNLAEPEFADRTASKFCDGVGLLRAEFMMAGIGTHPKKFIHDGKKHVFIEKLAQNLETFCSNFSPRPVVYRASDFKTNEYRQLIGGKAYEPEEANPMLGFRGAYRYVHDPEVFKLELEAIKLVREKKGFKNLWLMLPFVRTVRELIEVKKIISAAGLYRSANFKLWMMVEIPSNVILLEDFIHAGIDGVSIGSNDLTMLLLGTDRDNSEIAPEFDEQNPAVLWAFERVIKTCQKYKVTSSLCGQAASQYPSLLEKLVNWGITSVSVSPDAIDLTRQLISEFEKQLLKKK